ncbi:MAG: gluconate 2-dehydrogenase subunit 3 family protein [Bacteroidetes bacterium]|nr:gluconate 2-dehydrogenase subunit 3 family protein [Bacteroidota bacterium]
MNRRHALRHIALISGGLALIPSCDFSKEDILAAYENLKITATQKALLAAISDSIIPAGEIKGALDLEVPDFILVMVNDCFTKENQEKFTAGLQAFPDYAEKTAGKKFTDLSTKEKETLLLQGVTITGDENTSDGKLLTQIGYFLSSIKRFTIQGYMASEYIQTEIIPYSLNPGEYNGAVLISDLQKPRVNG